MSNRIKVFKPRGDRRFTTAMVWTRALSAQPQGGRIPALARASVAHGELPPEPVATTCDRALGPNARRAPTGNKTQSKLWIAGGAWWAVSGPRRAFHI
jgi:hypothetical protein